MTGFCLFLGDSPFYWRAVKQPCIAASTMEAEYVAMSMCEVLWVRSLLREVGFGDLVGDGPTTIWCDNQAAVRCAEDPVPVTSARHIDIKYHMVRNAVASGEVNISYVCTEDNRADIFTKSLPRLRHQKMVEGLRLGPCAAQC